MASSASNMWVLLGLGLAGILILTRKLKKTVKEDFGAFVQRLQLLPPPQPAPPKAPHPLTGLSFAVSDVIAEAWFAEYCEIIMLSMLAALQKHSVMNIGYVEFTCYLVVASLYRLLCIMLDPYGLFDIDGYVTEFGNPDWGRTHKAAYQTASAVLTMVQGGATCVGKTVVTEMAYSISGENKHFGTPTNPEAPARVPGGASSGAAVAVAANLVDFSLGIDTVGGVRLPAGFCGIMGFRPSHGVISLSGAIPVSSSLDAIGCFAKDPDVLRRVVHVLLQIQFTSQRNPRQILVADDCFELIKIPVDRVAQPVIRSTEKLFGSRFFTRQILKHVQLGDYISAKVPTLKELYGKAVNGMTKTSGLRLLATAMQFLLRHEFNQNHKEWINSVNPSLDPVITGHIHNMQELDEIDIQKLHRIRDEVRSALNLLLKDDGILVIPTFADPPPKLGGKDILSVDFESRLFCLSSIASMSGCCQSAGRLPCGQGSVAVPLGSHDKAPVSVSLLARHGGDRFLLDTLQAMYPSLQEQSGLASKSKLSRNVTINRELSADIAKEKGNKAYKDREWQQAISFYSEAIKLDPENATYYNNRAAAYLEAGSFHRAEADCTKVINLEKKVLFFLELTCRLLMFCYKSGMDLSGTLEVLILELVKC
ncbi:hypothetical protein Dimus_005115 [Dionaea muscipula]